MVHLLKKPDVHEATVAEDLNVDIAKQLWSFGSYRAILGPPFRDYCLEPMRSVGQELAERSSLRVGKLFGCDNLLIATNCSAPRHIIKVSD